MQTTFLLLLTVALTVTAGPIAAHQAQSPPSDPVPRAEAIVDNGEFMDLFMEPLYDELKRTVNIRP